MTWNTVHEECVELICIYVLNVWVAMLPLDEIFALMLSEITFGFCIMNGANLRKSAELNKIGDGFLMTTLGEKLDEIKFRDILLSDNWELISV